MAMVSLESRLRSLLVHPHATNPDSQNRLGKEQPTRYVPAGPTHPQPLATCSLRCPVDRVPPYSSAVLG